MSVIANFACSKEMIRCRNEVEEAVRMISSTYSSKSLSRNCKAKNSSYGSRFDNMAKCLIAVDALADNVDIWWARNKYTGVIVNESFIFVTHSLFPVRISKGIERRLRDRGGGGCCEVGGGGSGGGGVVGGVGVICGDGVDTRVGGVDCGVVCGFVCRVVCVGVMEPKRKTNMTRNDNFVGVQVKAPISAMIVRVPEKDRWCGTRSKFMRGVIVDGGGGEDIKHDTSVECFYYKTQSHVTTVFEFQRHQGDQDVDAKGNGY
ncbi:hypothetical protein Tco_1100334, partial [Tanacetum coccineum]